MKMQNKLLSSFMFNHVFIKKINIFIAVNPEEIAAPPQPNGTEANEPELLQYKDKKEAIEAFKELLKDRVC